MHAKKVGYGRVHFVTLVLVDREIKAWGTRLEVKRNVPGSAILNVKSVLTFCARK